MNIIEKALIFAAQAHSGQLRKDGHTPFIFHPVEVAHIASTMTDDPELLAACLLHDTIEDTDTTAEDIRREFGDRVLSVVACDTEEEDDSVPRSVSWYTRKEKSLKNLMNSSREIKILWLSDKLSNLRSLSMMYRAEGDEMWNRFNQKDKVVQRWYYFSIADLLSELENTAAYAEFTERLNTIFGEEP